MSDEREISPMPKEWFPEITTKRVTDKEFVRVLYYREKVQCVDGRIGNIELGIGYELIGDEPSDAVRDVRLRESAWQARELVRICDPAIDEWISDEDSLP